MFNGDELVIIDFGSCRSMGESIEGSGGTYEWCDETVKLSLPENDLKCFGRDSDLAWRGLAGFSVWGLTIPCCLVGLLLTFAWSQISKIKLV